MKKAASHAPHRAAFAFVFVTVLLDMLAIGIIIPVLPKLVVDFVGGDAAEGARIYGLFGTVWALMQFVFSSVQGALSDRFGRRPVILISNFGLGLDYIVTVSRAAGFAVFGLAPTGPVFWLGIPLMALWGLANPSAQGLMSRCIGPDKQGQLQGANASLMGVANLIGPGLFTLTFAFAIDAAKNLPGAPHLVAAMLLAIAIMVALRATGSAGVPPALSHGGGVS
jgi:DHA1 family tetracycline resistance protein-like MFS transporter